MELGVLLAVPLAGGCSTTATIMRNNGPPIEAHIKGGSSSSIVVEGEDGSEATIPRREIREVDHPGNVHTLLGGILIGYGTLNLAAASDTCRHQYRDQEEACWVGAASPLAIGLGLLAWGITVNSGSKSAFNNRTMSLPEPAPWIYTIPQRPPVAPAPARAPAPAAPSEAPSSPPESGSPSVSPPGATPDASPAPQTSPTPAAPAAPPAPESSPSKGALPLLQPGSE